MSADTQVHLYVGNWARNDWISVEKQILASKYNYPFWFLIANTNTTMIYTYAKKFKDGRLPMYISTYMEFSGFADSNTNT